MKAGVSVKEFYLDKGAAREQERIIKLLKPRLAQLGSDYCMCHLITDRIIALIKGENK